MMSRPLLLFATVSAAASAPAQARITYLTPPPQLTFGAREAVPAALVRIVHAITGEPVAGAELFAIGEEAHPLPGQFRALARVVADADGIAYAPHREAWLMTRATGLGPTMQLAPEHRVLPLSPAVDVPIRPVDWLGRPLVGAMFGFCGGCGHTPDLATAYVEADGVAWLRDVDPRGSFADIYPDTAPVCFTYTSTDWVPGDAPEEFAYQRGHELHGSVLQPDGTPAKFAPVGTYGVHRGPWAETDGKGRFRLFGLSEGESFFVEHAGRLIECPWPETMPCELRLPPPDGNTVQSLVPERPRDPSGPNDPGELCANIEFVDPHGNALDAISWWTKDGHRHCVRGSGPEWLLPGRYQVRIEHPDHAVVEREQVVLPAEDQEFRFELPRLPTVQIVAEGLVDGTLTVVRADSEREFEAPLGSIEVPVRADETFAVRLRHAETQQSRWFQFDGGAALALGTVRVAWFAPTKITAQIVDERGAPAAADVQLLPRATVLQSDIAFDPRTIDELVAAPDGAVALSSEQDRLCFLYVRPIAPELRPRLIAVPMPARADDARVDLGRIALTSAPQLALRSADGSLAAGNRAQLLRPGYGCFHGGVLPWFPLDERGRWLGPDLMVGDGVLVPGSKPGELPLRHVVRDRAPAVATTPTGRLRLRVRDADGNPLAATVLVRDCAFACAGELELGQVPPGPMVLFVLAEGSKTARIELPIDASSGPKETLSIEVSLPKL
jgi:hypothetical protein